MKILRHTCKVLILVFKNGVTLKNIMAFIFLAHAFLAWETRADDRSRYMTAKFKKFYQGLNFSDPTSHAIRDTDFFIDDLSIPTENFKREIDRYFDIVNLLKSLRPIGNRDPGGASDILSIASEQYKILKAQDLFLERSDLLKAGRLLSFFLKKTQLAGTSEVASFFLVTNSSFHIYFQLRQYKIEVSTFIDFLPLFLKKLQDTLAPFTFFRNFSFDLDDIVHLIDNYLIPLLPVESGEDWSEKAERSITEFTNALSRQLQTYALNRTQDNFLYRLEEAEDKRLFLRQHLEFLIEKSDSYCPSSNCPDIYAKKLKLFSYLVGRTDYDMEGPVSDITDITARGWDLMGRTQHKEDTSGFFSTTLPKLSNRLKVYGGAYNYFLKLAPNVDDYDAHVYAREVFLSGFNVHGLKLAFPTQFENLERAIRHKALHDSNEVAITLWKNFFEHTSLPAPPTVFRPKVPNCVVWCCRQLSRVRNGLSRK